MFKNYLSYQFALNFDRTCRSLAIQARVKDELIQSSEKMVQHFSKSLSAKNQSEEGRFLFVALICLRDCKDILEKAGIRAYDLWSQYEVLHKRLERLCESASDAERGQLRMLG